MPNFNVKSKLLLFNLGMACYLIGLLMSIGVGIQAGAISVLIGATIITGIFAYQLILIGRNSALNIGQALIFSGVLIVIATVFIHGFSASIDMMFLYRIEVFNILYFAAGFTLVVLFTYFSIKSANGDKKWIIIGTIAAGLLGIAGLLGYAQILSVPGQLIYYSWVFLLFFYLIFFVRILIRRKDRKKENIRFLFLTIAMLLFWMFRFRIPNGLEDGLLKALIYFGFVPLLILPLSLLSLKKFYSFTVFLFYFILLDFYFIHFDSNFSYLVNVGVNGCVGYEQDANFAINNDPGIPIKELLREPTKEELDAIRAEWMEKNFTPSTIEIVHEEEMPNGDSIKVISHLVNGLKHYGAVRVPQNIDSKNAPILMELEGGGTGIDVSKISTLTGGKCKSEKRNYLSILPSYRGCIIRGKDFCFRSEGYFGDAWLGAAEDAIAFLEVVKTLYDKPDDTRVIANGISRGATVALILGALTDKVDHIIAVSTHTKFLDFHVLDKERVGGSINRAFYTPKAVPEVIRERIIASSPYYFAEYLPPFELHQGTEDQQTTIWHAQMLQTHLRKIGKDSTTYDFYIYEGKGHGYDDDEIVCQTLSNFRNHK